MNENVLVTGASGFIGFNLVKKLIDCGYVVYALIEAQDYKGKNKLSKLDNINILTSFSELQNHLSVYPRFDYIFNLASVGVNPNFNDIEAFCDVNIKLPCLLIDIAKSNDTKLVVNFGSCFEYGDHGNTLIDEKMNCFPESLYAISKNSSVKLFNK